MNLIWTNFFYFLYPRIIDYIGEFRGCFVQKMGLK